MNLPSVMAGLDPAIQVGRSNVRALLASQREISAFAAWMAGSSPATTETAATRVFERRNGPRRRTLGKPAVPNRNGCQGSPAATAAGGAPEGRVLDSRSGLEVSQPRARQRGPFRRGHGASARQETRANGGVAELPRAGRLGRRSGATKGELCKRRGNTSAIPDSGTKGISSSCRRISVSLEVNRGVCCAPEVRQAI
jgi:hypothetical protein